jgi:hypothetical protein
MLSIFSSQCRNRRHLFRHRFVLTVSLWFSYFFSVVSVRIAAHSDSLALGVADVRCVDLTPFNPGFYYCADLSFKFSNMLLAQLLMEIHSVSLERITKFSAARSYPTLKLATRSIQQQATYV